MVYNYFEDLESGKQSEMGVEPQHNNNIINPN